MNNPAKVGVTPVVAIHREVWVVQDEGLQWPLCLRDTWMTLGTGVIDISRNLSKYLDDWYGPTFAYWLNTSLVCIYNGGITFIVSSEGRFSEQGAILMS